AFDITMSGRTQRVPPSHSVCVRREQCMEIELPIRLVLVDPPAGVDFGIQQGKGVEYETLFAQQRGHGDISFDFALTVKDNRKDGLPNFLGPLAQGTVDSRFIYVD